MTGRWVCFYTRESPPGAPPGASHGRRRTHNASLYGVVPPLHIPGSCSLACDRFDVSGPAVYAIGTYTRRASCGCYQRIHSSTQSKCVVQGATRTAQCGRPGHHHPLSYFAAASSGQNRRHIGPGSGDDGMYGQRKSLWSLQDMVTTFHAMLKD